MLKLTEHVGITISLLYKQKTRWNSDIQNFYSEIVLILVCMDREGPYLPIDTKINFIGGSVWKM